MYRTHSVHQDKNQETDSAKLIRLFDSLVLRLGGGGGGEEKKSINILFLVPLPDQQL